MTHSLLYDILFHIKGLKIINREKLIAEIKKWDIEKFNMELDQYDMIESLADHILNADLSVEKTLDLSKKKEITPADLLNMVKLGAKPILVCNSHIDDMGIDTPWETGMYARVKSASVQDDGLLITVNLEEFQDINDGMATHDWYMKGGSGKMGTAKEAGWWTPEESIWVPLDDVDFKLEMVEE